MAPARARLEAAAAVIAGLLAGFAASTWTRAALRSGAIVLAVLLFLLSLRRSRRCSRITP